MKVADPLRPLLRNVEDLIPLPGNPRRGDLAAITDSLNRFGQLKPVVVNAEDVILAGNHTYQAAVALGWTQVAAVTVELEGAEQPAFALADNRLSDLSTYNNEALLAMLSEVDDLTGIGYDEGDLATLGRRADAWAGNALDPSQADEIGRLLGIGEWDQTERFEQYPKLLINFPDEQARAEFIESSGVIASGNGSAWWPERPDTRPVSQGRGAQKPYSDRP